MKTQKRNVRRSSAVTIGSNPSAAAGAPITGKQLLPGGLQRIPQAVCYHLVTRW